MTSASGTYTYCGFGQPFSLKFTCTGPNCDYLDGFPGTNCTSDGKTLTCSNGVVCPPGSNYTSAFSLDQPLNAITQTTQIFLSDACTEIEATNNGTGSGVNVVSKPIANCTPVISSSVPSSSTASNTSSIPSSSSTVLSTSHTTSASSTSGRPSGTSSTTSGLSSSVHSLTSSGPSSSEHSSTLSPASTSGSGPANNTPLPSNIAPNTAVAASSSEASPAAASTSAATGSISSPHQPATSSGPAQVSTSNARAMRQPSSLTIFYVIFVIFALFQTTIALDATTADAGSALSVELKSLPNDTTPNFAISELRPRGESSLGKQFTDLIAEYIAGKITTPELADTFLDEIFNAICTHFVGLVVTTSIFAEVGQFVEYATLVFDTIALPAGPAGWLIAFSFTVALNVLVSEMFPQIDQIVSQACEQPKPCSEDFTKDSKNCGRCGNPCASGVCKNSACVSNTCTGETCENFTACGPGGTCVCASTAEGTGFCVDGSTACAGLQTCATSTSCPAGQICAVASCCEINVCVGASFCGGANSSSATRLLFRRELDERTFSHLY